MEHIPSWSDSILLFVVLPRIFPPVALLFKAFGEWLLFFDYFVFSECMFEANRILYYTTKKYYNQRSNLFSKDGLSKCSIWPFWLKRIACVTYPRTARSGEKFLKVLHDC